jgi:predicted AlkP superfamily pyrophosphatase or phosphodiesterase
VPRLLLALLLFSPALSAAAESSPRLVLLISVDQLRRDRLDARLPGGLGRLAREGRVHLEGALDHALTETCAGHATMLTGRHPGAAGLPGNSFIDAKAGQSVYCVSDPAEDARVIGAEQGRSPRNLRVTTLGDWMKAARPETRVFSVSGKDRGAIALGGQHPDAAYWFNRKGALGFTTSRYYRESLPDWVAGFNSGFVDDLPETWAHALDGAPPPPPPRPDDYPGESSDYSRTTPHPLRDSDPKKFADNLYFSPYLDEITLKFATELVEKEKLGESGGADLLAVSLSASDAVGHLYGPNSHEARDALLRLDRALGEFLGFLEARLGEGKLLVALTSDHGVLPLPEWLEETGANRCPVVGSRVGMRRLGLGLSWELHRTFTPIVALPKEWVVFAGSQIGVSRRVASEQGVEVGAIVAAVERYLEAEPSVAQVWTAGELEQSDSEIARLYRNSRDPERSGDLLVQLEPACLISPFDHGTSHGSPYPYDRAVPILFWGDGIAPARVEGPAATVDIAPTLARHLGLEPPPDLDGRPLVD